MRLVVPSSQRKACVLAPARRTAHRNPPSWPPKTAPAMIEAMIDCFDRDQDGAITEDEFKFIMEQDAYEDTDAHYGRRI